MSLALAIARASKSASLEVMYAVSEPRSPTMDPKADLSCLDHPSKLLSAPICDKCAYQSCPARYRSPLCSTVARVSDLHDTSRFVAADQGSAPYARCPSPRVCQRSRHGGRSSGCTKTWKLPCARHSSSGGCGTYRVYYKISSTWILSKEQGVGMGCATYSK